MAAQPLKNQRGFGIIEAVVAMSLLSIATLAIVQWFSLSRNSQLKTDISKKNLQAQRSLEQVIWAEYRIDPPPANPGPCSIRNNSTIGLNNDGSCTSGNGTSVRAQRTELLTSNCNTPTYNNTNRTLSLSNCPANLAGVINEIPNKQDFRVIVWGEGISSTFCALEDSSNPASSTQSGDLQLRMSADCNLPGALPTTTPATVWARLPNYSIRFSDKNNDSVYHRFYY